jgi:quercetin dioxygenase-like cupin family protein
LIFHRNPPFLTSIKNLIINLVVKSLQTILSKIIQYIYIFSCHTHCIKEEPMIQLFNGSEVLTDKMRKSEELTWNEHSSFKGVFMKHLVCGEQTNGAMSCHLVRIEPGHEIGLHLHQGKLELHEVMSGSGSLLRGDVAHEYRPGTVAVIPADVNHRVIAGNEGLFLFATFTPSLV